MKATHKGQGVRKRTNFLKTNKHPVPPRAKKSGITGIAKRNAMKHRSCK